MRGKEDAILSEIFGRDVNHIDPVELHALTKSHAVGCKRIEIDHSKTFGALRKVNGAGHRLGQNGIQDGSPIAIGIAALFTATTVTGPAYRVTLPAVMLVAWLRRMRFNG